VPGRPVIWRPKGRPALSPRGIVTTGVPSWLSGTVNDSRAGADRDRSAVDVDGVGVERRGDDRCRWGDECVNAADRPGGLNADKLARPLGLQVVGRRQRRTGLELVKHRRLIAWPLVVDPLAVDGRRLSELDDGVDRVDALEPRQLDRAYLGAKRLEERGRGAGGGGDLGVTAGLDELGQEADRAPANVQRRIAADVPGGAEGPAGDHLVQQRRVADRPRQRPDRVVRPGERTTPAVGTRPWVGRTATSPHSDAGPRSEPLVSVPRPPRASPAPVAHAGPALEPPEMRVRSRGFRQSPSAGCGRRCRTRTCWCCPCR
jgi:hypothetical protein